MIFTKTKKIQKLEWKLKEAESYYAWLKLFYDETKSKLKSTNSKYEELKKQYTKLNKENEKTIKENKKLKNDLELALNKLLSKNPNLYEWVVKNFEIKNG